ncbi:MAG: hypothetical protein ACI8WT_004736 [Clostridium sp.]|jgi:hypothetical protein
MNTETEQLKSIENQQFNSNELAIIRLGEDPEDFDHFVTESLVNNK